MLATAGTLIATTAVIWALGIGFVGGIAFTHWETKRRRESGDNYRRLRKHQLDRITIHGDGAAIVSVRETSQPFDQEMS